MRRSVRVPATSANLGPGFDTLGLALDIWDELSAEPLAGTDSTVIEVTGAGSDTVARDESHLVLRSMRATERVLGVPSGPVRLRCHNTIPHGRGLGSSAAAICAGVMLAGALAGLEHDPGAALAIAAGIEGHADNVAACLLGGLSIAWSAGPTDSRVAQAIRLKAVPLTPVLFIPQSESSTERARAVLPASVPHSDAAFTAARAALLVAALTSAPQQLLEATRDRLHQQYRSPAMPESAALTERLRAAGIPAVISGAGPTVLALALDAEEAERTVALRPAGWQRVVTSVTVHGAILS